MYSSGSQRGVDSPNTGWNIRDRTWRHWTRSSAWHNCHVRVSCCVLGGREVLSRNLLSQNKPNTFIHVLLFFKTPLPTNGDNINLWEIHVAGKMRKTAKQICFVFFISLSLVVFYIFRAQTVFKWNHVGRCNCQQLSDILNMTMQDKNHCSFKQL